MGVGLVVMCFECDILHIDIIYCSNLSYNLCVCFCMHLYLYTFIIAAEEEKGCRNRDCRVSGGTGKDERRTDSTA